MDGINFPRLQGECPHRLDGWIYGSPMARWSYDGASAVLRGAQPEGSADVGPTGRETGRGSGVGVILLDRTEIGWTL